MIDLIEFLDLRLSQLAEVGLHQLAVRHVQLVGVEPLGLEDIYIDTYIEWFLRSLTLISYVMLPVGG